MKFPLLNFFWVVLPAEPVLDGPSLALGLNQAQPKVTDYFLTP